jgi:mannosyl-3-phosphoglycerate phosphatase
MRSRISRQASDPLNILVITDLDGTLLDFHDYSFAPAEPALRMLRRLGVPVICCSSKTSREIKYWRRELKLRDPFICENGAAVFFPANRFANYRGRLVVRGSHLVKEMGLRKSRIRAVFEKVRRETSIEMVGFSDMEIATVKSLCGFKTMRQAKMAADREYSEPFIFPPRVKEDEGTIEKVLIRFKELGLNVIRGRRFFHLIGDTDKGRAVRFLKNFYSEIDQPKSVTIGIGDSTNDLEMLEAVDIPVLVMGKNRRYDPVVRGRVDPLLAGAPGPSGWRRALEKLLS